jgi:hypothetical protein
MTASIDLALAMIEKDHGHNVARSVARKLVVYAGAGGVVTHCIQRRHLYTRFQSPASGFTVAIHEHRIPGPWFTQSGDDL